MINVFACLAFINIWLAGYSFGYLTGWLSWTLHFTAGGLGILSLKLLDMEYNRGKETKDGG